MRFLEPLFALDPVLTRTKTVPWNHLIENCYFGIDNTACKTGNYINMFSVGIKQTDTQTFESYFEDLTAFSRRNPGINSHLVIHRFPTQAVQAVADNETAYPHRDIKMHV